jgi:hypothetical protein
MRYPLVIDFETKKTFREAPDPKDLGISVAGVYDYKTEKLLTFEEHELNEMFSLFEKASILIGFNIDHFDLPVVQHYYPGDIFQFRTFDILADVKRILGRRIRLDDLVTATLGEGKSGHGLLAIKYFREGKMDELKKYCLDDVRLTKNLFDYGVKEGRIYYPQGLGNGEKSTLHVQWGKYMDYEGQGDNVSLTLPF